MEVIGAAASITAIVDISVKILVWTAEYAKNVAAAPSEIAALSQGLGTLNSVLLAIRNQNSGQIFSSVAQNLDQCRQDIEKVAETLELDKKARKAIKVMLWPFKQKEIREFLEKLSQHLQLFTLALAGDQMSLTLESKKLIVDGMAISGDIRDAVRRLEHLMLTSNTTSKDSQSLQGASQETQKKGVLEWLLKVNYNSNHKAASRSRGPGTCEWLTRSHSFESWLSDNENGNKSFIWLSGIVGTGKTILMSSVINHAKMLHTALHPDRTVAAGIAFFYLDSRESSKRSVTTMLLSLIRQLLEPLSEVPVALMALRQETLIGDTPDVDDLVYCLAEIVHLFRRCFIFVDALDEADPLEEFLRILCNMTEALPRSARFLVTSRNEPIIEARLSAAGFTHVPIPRTKVDNDIRSYVEDRSNTDLKKKFDTFSKQLHKEIIESLTLKSQGMFLLARWQLNEICQQVTENEVRTALSRLPQTLNETYQDILRKVNPEHLKWAKRALFWATSAIGPMDLHILHEALTVDLKDFKVKSDELLLDEDLILEICRSLLTLQDGSTIALAHPSLGNFLLSSEAKDFYMDRESIHVNAARASFAYLTCGKFNIAEWEEEQGLDRFMRLRKARESLSFLAYCCDRAFEHLGLSSLATTNSSDSILGFLKQPRYRLLLHQSFHFLDDNRDHVTYSERFLDRKPPLLFGSPNRGEATNTQSYGCLELSWNSSPISRLVVENASAHATMLIDSDLLFLEQDEKRWSALSFSAAYGNRECLERMLEVLDNTTTLFLRPFGTALIAAIGAQAMESVDLLINRLYPDGISGSADLDFLRGMSIILSTILGNEVILQKFLEIAATNDGAESIDNDAIFQIALIAAVSSESLPCVLKLISHGIIPKPSPTPGCYEGIWEAETSQIFSTAKDVWESRLLQQPFSPSSSSSLQLADEDVSLADERSAFKAAANRRNQNILIVLKSVCVDELHMIPYFEKSKLSFTRKEYNGDIFSPIESIMDEILDTTKDSSTKSLFLGQAILWCVSDQSRLGLLASLLEAGADPNSLSNDKSYSPLLLAVENGCLESLKLLLRNGANPNVRNSSSWPLGTLEAAITLVHHSNHRSMDILNELLLAGADVNFDNFGTSNHLLFKACDVRDPWYYSASKDQVDTLEPNLAQTLVRALLQFGANPNALAVDGPFGSPLIAACAHANLGLAQRLLHHGARVNIETSCGEYSSALVAAARHGDIELVELILRYDSNLEEPIKHPVHRISAKCLENDNWQQSYLIAAVVGGRLDVVRHLLDISNNSKVNEAVESSQFGTPLIAAAYGGDVEIVKLLLERGAAGDLEGPGKSDLYRTPLVAAILQQNEEAVNILLKHNSSKAWERHPALWSTALVACIVKNNKRLLELLLSLGIPLNVSCESEGSQFSKYAFPIIAAARRGNIDLFKILSASGADTRVHEVGRYGDCLTAAAVSGNIGLVSMLLEEGARPDVLNPGRKYWSPFVAVARKNHTTIFHALTAAGGNPNIFHSPVCPYLPSSWTRRQQQKGEGTFALLAILRYVQEGYIILRTGENWGADYEVDVFDGHPLISAIRCDKDDMIELLLHHGCKSDLIAETGYYRNPLIAAIESSSDSNTSITRLIDLGATPSQQIPHDSRGSAFIAASRHQPYNGDSRIDILQDLGLEIVPHHTVSHCVYGSMLIAASSKPRCFGSPTRELELVKALLDEGCKPQDEVKGSLYGCALIAAASEVRLDFLEEFVKAGIDLNKRTGEGLFGYAILAAISRESRTHLKFKYNFQEEERKFKFVQRLLELGADPNVSFNHRTPLITLVDENVRNFDEDIAEALLQKGADPNTLQVRYIEDFDSEGKSATEMCSAMSLAAERGKDNLVELFLKCGGDATLLPAGYKVQGVRRAK